MSRPTQLPENPVLAGRALRLDAALAAAGMDLAELGPQIGLKTSAARTLWRHGKSPQVNRWESAAKLLGVDVVWLLDGIGIPPRRVAERLAWLRANPDLPPHLAGPKLSRRLDPLDQAEVDLAVSELGAFQRGK